LVNDSEHSKSAGAKPIFKKLLAVFISFSGGTESMAVRPRTAWFLEVLLEKKRKKKKKGKKKKRKRKKKGEFRAGLYPPGIESRNTTPHAINWLVEVKKASSPPSSTTSCVLAHTESRGRDNGCARVACVQGVVRVAG
jgi:hypothetical protein